MYDEGGAERDKIGKLTPCLCDVCDEKGIEASGAKGEEGRGE